MHAPYVNLRLGAINIEERQISINIFLNAMRLTSDLGIKTLTFHPCTLEPNAPELYSENCLFEEGSISLLLNEAKKMGITLLIENMPLLPEYHPKTTDVVPASRSCFGYSLSRNSVSHLIWDMLYKPE